jgi:hypothetical protein
MILARSGGCTASIPLFKNLVSVVLEEEEAGAKRMLADNNKKKYYTKREGRLEHYAKSRAVLAKYAN